MKEHLMFFIVCGTTLLLHKIVCNVMNLSISFHMLIIYLKFVVIVIGQMDTS